MSSVQNTINRGGGGGTSITVVANYSALPDPTTVSGQFYWCENSQGTAWLPGSLGGTYYSAGQYYSNGTSWSFIAVPYQATQDEVNTGTNTDKFVTPSTLAGWFTYVKGLAQTISGLWTFGVGTIYTPIATPTYVRGRVFYDQNNECLSYMDDVSGTSMQIGQEMIIRARNNSGSTITNGQVVYINGALGQNPTIALAKSDSITTCEVIGIATHDIANNTIGKVTTFGLVNDLDTSSFLDGAILYLSASTAGALTSTVPTNPNFNVVVGIVAHSHATQGKILVHPLAPISLKTTLGTSSAFTVSEKVVSDNLALKQDKQIWLSNTSPYTLTSQTALQKAFNIGTNGALDAQVRTYKFEGLISLSSLSSSNGNTSFGFLGTATVASIRYTHVSMKGVLVSTPFSSLVTTTSQTILTNNNTNTTAYMHVMGIVRISGAGTLIPAVGMSTAAAAVVDANSYFTFTELGTDTDTNSTIGTS